MKFEKYLTEDSSYTFDLADGPKKVLFHVGWILGTSLMYELKHTNPKAANELSKIVISLESFSKKHFTENKK